MLPTPYQTTDQLLAELSDGHRKFTLAYVQCFNATQAAIDAGYSENSAHVTGSRLLKDAKVAAAIQRFFDENVMTAQEVLYHLTQIARGDIALVVDSGGSPDMKKATGNYASNLIKKLKTKTTIIASSSGEGSDIETHEVEVEIYDRLKALELLARFHDLINKTRIEDWRTDAIQLIRAGQLEYAPLAAEVGDGLANELFEMAGVPLLQSGDENPD